MADGFEDYKTGANSIRGQVVTCAFCDTAHSRQSEDLFVQRDGPGSVAVCQSCVTMLSGVIARHAHEKGPRIV